MTLCETIHMGTHNYINIYNLNLDIVVIMKLNINSEVNSFFLNIVPYNRLHTVNVKSVSSAPI